MQAKADMDTAGLSVTRSVAPEKSYLAHTISSHLSYRLILPLLSCAIPGMVFASPEGGQVVAGSATISNPDANTTLINQSTSHAAIDWQRFNIGTQEYVQFAQPDASSVALNRVVGGDPSSILGNLSANGQIFLVNPNGVYFGHGATIDVGGIVASVHNIRNEDFMSGNYVFSKADGAPDDAGVVNDGVITARDGGYVVLMGNHVHNNGVISARMGTVALAAGNQITMDVKANGLVSVAVDEETASNLAEVRNTGEIMAAGGRVMMTARVASDLIDTAINNEGLVVANSIAERDGAIFLTAAGGDVVNSGTLDASAENGSNVDGGGVLVYSDKDVINASGAEINAKGDGSGDGGVVRVVAEEFMDHQAGALIDVTSEAGDGGFVEVSGHDSLAIKGDIELGSGGEFLIDPGQLTIRNSDAIGTPSSTTGGSPTPTNGFVNRGFIEDQLNSNVNITLVANNSINASAGTATGGAFFTINATLGSGDLSLVNGSVTSAVAGTFGACTMTGVCLPATGGNGISPSAAGNINLGTVSININGDLNVSAGTVTGTASLGNITASAVTVTAGNDVDLKDVTAGGVLNVSAGRDVRLGSSSSSATINAVGNIAITAGNDIRMFSHVAQAGTSFFASAGNNLLIGRPSTGSPGGIGAPGAAVAASISLNAGANIDIEADVFTQNSMTISAQNLTISGVVLGDGSGFGTSDKTEVHADNNITVNVTNLVDIDGASKGLFSSFSDGFDVSALMTAGNNITINATDLLVGAGSAQIDLASSAVSVSGKANAEINAANNVILNLTGNLTVSGGIADVTAAMSTFGGVGDVAIANVTADAIINAGNEVRINSVGGNLSVTGGNATANANANLGCSVCTGTDGPDAFATANANAAITGGTVTILSVGNGITINGGTVAVSAVATNLDTLFPAPALADAQALAGAAIDGGNVNISGVGGSLRVNSGTVTAFSTSGNGIKTISADAGAKLHADTNLTANVNGDVNLGTSGANAIISAGVVANITANSSINISGIVTAGGSLIMAAGNSGSLNLNHDIGSSGSALNANVSLSGEYVNIDSDIYLGANTLTLSGNGGESGGGVFVNGSSTEKRTVSTQGALNVRGDNFTVKGATFLPTSILNDVPVNVQASAIDVSISGDVFISGGSYPVTSAVISGTASASVSVNATNNITINANSLTVKGGVASIDAISGSANVTANANASLVAGDNLTAVLGSALNVKGGVTTINGGGGAPAFNANANAVLKAGSNLNVTAGSANLSIGTVNPPIGGGVLTPSANSRVEGGNITLNVTGSMNANSANVSAANNVAITAGGYTENINNSIIAGNNLTVSAGGNYNVNGNYNAGNLLSLSAGSTLDLNIDLGASGAVLNHDVALAGNNVIIDQNIHLGNNALTIAGGAGTVSILGSSAAPLTVSTQGVLSITGNNLVVKDTTTGSASVSPSVGVAASTIDIVLTGDMDISAGSYTATSAVSGPSVSVNASVVASNDISITAQNLSVKGGSAVAATGSNALTVTANAKLDAGGDLTLIINNDINVGGGNALADADRTAEANADITAGGNVTITAANVNLNGGTESVSGTGAAVASAKSKLQAGSALSVIATGNITGNNADISANGMYMEADNNIDLATSNISVGNGTVAGIEGDAITLAFLATKGITPPTTPNPNAKFRAGGELNMGTITMDGDIPYLWLEADTTNIAGLTLPEASDVVVQFSPYTLTATITVEDEPVPTNTFVNYNNLEHFGILPGTTIIIGSSLHTGDIIIGDLGDIDIVSKNMVAVTSSSISSISNVISTGIVAELIIGGFNNEFVTPILTEVQVSLDPVDDPSKEKDKKKNLVEDDEEEIKECKA